LPPNKHAFTAKAVWADFFALVTLGFYKLCFQGYLNKSTHAISLETGRFFSGTDDLILQGEVGFDGSTIQNRIL
jgi:hypothetical protein